jgi:NhaP-type Na+/H+ or K+/H+ antiporter
MCAVQDCLAMGAIFAATDSVATLQVLDRETMPGLFSLVFGEGVVNDAGAVAWLRMTAAARALPAAMHSQSKNTQHTRYILLHCDHGKKREAATLWLVRTQRNSMCYGRAAGPGRLAHT